MDNKDQIKAQFTEILSKNGILVGANEIRVSAYKHLGIYLLGKIDFFFNHCGYRVVR